MTLCQIYPRALQDGFSDYRCVTYGLPDYVALKSTAATPRLGVHYQEALVYLLPHSVAQGVFFLHLFRIVVHDVIHFFAWGRSPAHAVFSRLGTQTAAGGLQRVKELHNHQNLGTPVLNHPRQLHVDPSSRRIGSRRQVGSTRVGKASQWRKTPYPQPLFGQIGRIVL